jgi:murein DD-endopeptidase MepM/ murein hydrolase activator NlpD
VSGCSLSEVSSSDTANPGSTDPQTGKSASQPASTSAAAIVATAAAQAGWRMPWASGATYKLTGGPHNGTSLTPCAQVAMSGSSGLDFGLSSNEVLTVEDGTIRDWGDNGNTAPKLKWVIVDHGNGWSTRYWHLASFNTDLTNLVKGKSFVSQGRIVGVSGSPDGAAHLHLELRLDGSPSPWNGQTIDSYGVHGMPLQSNSSLQINYQGTMTRGTETTANVNYAPCSSTAVVKTSGTTTIEAGSSSTITSTNTRRTQNEPSFIADDGTSFARFGTTTWTSAATGYNNQMWWARSNGSVKNNFARWTLPASMGAGTYKIYAYIAATNATTLHAKYQIVHNGTSEFAPDLNQQRNSDVWVRVGNPTQTYFFSGSGTEYVELSDATGEAAGATQVGVDALIFVNTAPAGPTCGSSCTQCVLNARTDILPFYQANGWDTSCPNRNAIVSNWCGIDPSGCVSIKSSATCQASCITSGSCGNACTACVLQQRTDILPFYQANGWDTSCGNRNAIVANWCTIDPSGCAAVKTGGACRTSCGL